MKNPSYLQRWDAYQPTKTAVVWLCLGSIAATLIVGFGWGGWVRGSTAESMASKSAATAQAELAAAVCVHQFTSGANAVAQFASLKAADSWKRDTFIEEGGWVTLPGAQKPVAGAAALCSQTLMEMPVKAAASG